jgi:transcriptional regulator with GAF, ATPase, and Fis domain
MLIRHLPIQRIIVREIDTGRSCVETVAAGPHARSATPSDGRAALAPGEMRKLLVWSQRQELTAVAWPPSGLDPLRKLVPSGVEAEILAGPLVSQEGRIGVLLLQAPPSVRFEPRHRLMGRALLEPFSVAIENDRRLRELRALREAAEADKQSLLSRLGRKELADTLIGADAGLQPVMERVKLVSRSDLPVLILGETGTGKEVIARAIHTQSARAAAPFIRVNCGAIPSELIDSQLFGHERGSFTGATDQHKGWFERADGGTLFLDEIGELSHAAQIRLLRILQDGYLERVGARAQIRVDVRIVVATHQDLTLMIREGRFREDLWYRIAVFPILLPPLRERGQDIPALARHFAERAAIRFGLAPRMPAPDDIAALLAYPWPGHVRELQTVIDRAAILGEGQSLKVETALGVSPGVSPIVVGLLSANGRVAPVEGLPSSGLAPLDTAMRQHIEAALIKTRGRIEGPFGAATALQINPHTLRARMRKLGIDWRAYRTAIGQMG